MVATVAGIVMAVYGAVKQGEAQQNAQNAATASMYAQHAEQTNAAALQMMQNNQSAFTLPPSPFMGMMG